MKINICSFTGFHSLSGSNLRVFHLTNELMRRGIDVSYLVPCDKDAESVRERFGDLRIRTVGMEIKRFSRSRIPRYPLFAFTACMKIDKDSDIIFGQSLPSALAVRLCRTKAKKVVDYVDPWSEYWLYAQPNPLGSLVYHIVRKAEGFSLDVDQVFTITRTLKQMLEERGGKPEKIRIVRDGVDTRIFKPMQVKPGFLEKYGLERSVDYVTFQGGISKHDGVQFMVDAAPAVLKENPDAKFLIVGMGDYLDSIKSMVHQKGLDKSFIFTGWVPYEDMPQFMNISKINVVPIADAPSTRGVVTLKLYEAMGCGTPTIISGLPGVREHVKHTETGYLVNKSEDIDSLASGINRLLNDRKMYNRIRSNGLRIVPHYDWGLIVKEMADQLVES
jgi:glycosyltransferase involved in cell wall biosynthesis